MLKNKEKPITICNITQLIMFTFCAILIVLLSNVNVKAADNICIIKYDANGGSGSMHDQEIDDDEEVKLYQNKFTGPSVKYPGYKSHFVSWNTEKDGSGTSYQDTEFIKGIGGTQITLYAQWSSPSVEESGGSFTKTIVLDKKGGTKGTDKITITREYDFSYKGDYHYNHEWQYFYVNNIIEPQKVEIPQKTDYIFMGYTFSEIPQAGFTYGNNYNDNYYLSDQEIKFQMYRNDTYSEQIIYDNKGNLIESNFNRKYPLGQNNEFKVYSPLCAIWAKKITFDSNGGEGTMDPQFAFEQNIPYLTLNDCKFTKKGYQFIGWTEKGSNNRKVYTEGDRIKDLSITKEEICLSAVWKKIEQSDTTYFKLDKDTSGAISKIEVYDNSITTKSEYAPTDKIYVHGGDVVKIYGNMLIPEKEHDSKTKREHFDASECLVFIVPPNVQKGETALLCFHPFTAIWGQAGTQPITLGSRTEPDSQSSTGWLYMINLLRESDFNHISSSYHIGSDGSKAIYFSIHAPAVKIKCEKYRDGRLIASNIYTTGRDEKTGTNNFNVVCSPGDQIFVTNLELDSTDKNYRNVFNKISPFNDTSVSIKDFSFVIPDYAVGAGKMVLDGNTVNWKISEGWCQYVDVQGEQKHINSNAEKYLDDPIEPLPEYDDTKYIINFDSNGGTGTMQSIQASYNENITLPLNKFKNTGYDFIGWSLNKDEPPAYTNGGTVSNLATEGNSVTLYAVWKKSERSGNKDDGESEVVVTGEITSSYKVKLPAMLILTKSTNDGDKTNYSADYNIAVAGNIDAEKFVNVVPDISGFIMKDTSGKRQFKPDLKAEKVAWTANDLDNVEDDTFVEADSKIVTKVSKAGKYNGQIVYNFALSDVEAENTFKD